jgi:hypothetical protein
MAVWFPEDFPMTSSGAGVIRTDEQLIEIRRRESNNTWQLCQSYLRGWSIAFTHLNMINISYLIILVIYYSGIPRFLGDFNKF